MSDFDGEIETTDCDICGNEMYFEECTNCEDGVISGYEEDPLWYEPDDYIQCSTCGGKGGWWVCHEEHEVKP